MSSQHVNASFPDGKIKGFKNKALNFLGIDYAQSIQGINRWQPSTTKAITQHSAVAFGPMAVQVEEKNPLIMAGAEFLDKDEQCLNLNVYTPSTDKKLPVMVWIHGGGFQLGSGSLTSYQGENLAKNANVVVVTINYRLGALGFLRLCDISNDTIAATGNEGLMDQITALKWVQENIGHFGGDKNNVTVFGESAGAMSIACLLASPHAKGLFHKAILQSGAAHTYSSIDKANDVAQEFVKSAKELGFSLAQLNSISATELLSIQQHFLARGEVYQKFGILPFTPVVDGDLLPIEPYEAIRQGCAKDIAILSGSNTDEWTLFAAMLQQNTKSNDELKITLQHFLGEDLVAPCLSLVDKQLKQRQHHISPQTRLNEAYTEYWFAQPCHRLLSNHAEAGGKSYRYKLGRRTVIKRLACTHITDVGFVFGNTMPAFHGDEPRVNELVDGIQACWANFAYFGTPATDTLQWPQYQQSNNFGYVFFDHDETYVTQVESNSANFWAQITDQQLAEF